MDRLYDHTEYLRGRRRRNHFLCNCRGNQDASYHHCGCLHCRQRRSAEDNSDRRQTKRY